MHLAGENSVAGQPTGPSPSFDTERWFHKQHGKKSGPIDTDSLRQLVESGALLLTTPVWREGMSDWLPAEEVPGLVPPQILLNARLSSKVMDSRGSRRRIIIGLVAVLAVLTVWVWLPRGWLAYERVSGTITYADGTPLPVDGMIIHFHSLVRARDAQSLPPVGVAVVDRASGVFSSATTRFPGDGILAGVHKVTLHDAAKQPLRESIASVDYAEPNRTTLRIDTKNRPFKIVVEKP